MFALSVNNLNRIHIIMIYQLMGPGRGSEVDIHLFVVSYLEHNDVYQELFSV